MKLLVVEIEGVKRAYEGDRIDLAEVDAKSRMLKQMEAELQ